MFFLSQCEPIGEEGRIWHASLWMRLVEAERHWVRIRISRLIIRVLEFDKYFGQCAFPGHTLFRVWRDV